MISYAKINIFCNDICISVASIFLFASLMTIQHYYNIQVFALAPILVDGSTLFGIIDISHCNSTINCIKKYGEFINNNQVTEVAFSSIKRQKNIIPPIIVIQTIFHIIHPLFQFAFIVINLIFKNNQNIEIIHKLITILYILISMVAFYSSMFKKDIAICLLWCAYIGISALFKLLFIKETQTSEI